MTGLNLLMQKLDVTIGLQVSFLFVCEIAIHSVSTSPEDCAFVDHQGLHDQLTSTEQTPCRGGFRSDVMRRDGPTCVVTQERKEHCDAAHLIPWSKGDEVKL
jgi:hypothetical protein